MITFGHLKSCKRCAVAIDDNVFLYSMQNFNYPLCRPCQNWFKDFVDYSSASEVSLGLYFALKQRGVPALIEKDDGFKTIDIAVPEAKVNIEVDGGQHNYDARQALSDLHRTVYSFKKGFYTLRIPNSLVKHNIEQTANLITDFLVESKKKMNKGKM